MPPRALRSRWRRPRGLRADLFDGVAQLAAQHHPRVAGPGVQARVEGELAVVVGPDQLHLAQLLDEAAEQRLVEEFRRGVGVEQRQALRGEVAQGLEFARAERARAV